MDTDKIAQSLLRSNAYDESSDIFTWLIEGKSQILFYIDDDNVSLVTEL